MINSLNLSSEEQLDLEKAIVWVTLLIAGADGSIDEEELAWAEKITNIRGYNVPHSLNDYYISVGANFQAQLDAEISTLPESTEERISCLSENLTRLNPILAKIDNRSAYELYTSYVSFAEHVAKATGGFMRFFSISSEEKKLLDLPMLDKIELLEA